MKIMYDKDINTILNYFQGDDISAILNSYSEAKWYYNFMLSLGFGVNAKKIFVSTDRNEFLRYVITKDAIFGYPARALNAIMWRSPINPEPPRGKDRVNEICNNWLTVISRGMDKERCFKHMKSDILRGNKGILNLKQLNCLLRTPKAYGGLGLLIEDGPWGRIDTDKTTKNFTYKERLVGLNYTDTFWGTKFIPQPSQLGSWNELLDRYESKFVEIVPVNQKEFLNILPTGIDNTKPIWNDNVPLFYKNDYLRIFLNDKTIVNRYEYVDSLLVNSDVSYRIRVRGGKRVWMDWLTDELPFATPNVVEMHPSQCSRVYLRYINTMWNKVLFKTFRYTKVLDIAHRAEIMTHRYWRSALGNDTIMGR